MTQSAQGITVDYASIMPDKKNQSPANSLSSFGDIIKATVVALENSAAVLRVDENFSFTAEKSSLKGDISLGDELSFQIINQGSSNITLKQISVETQKQNTAHLNADEMKGILESQGLLAEKPDEERRKADETMARIKRNLSALSGNTAKDALKALVKEGIAIERITIDMLNTAMRETESEAALASVKNETESAAFSEKNGDTEPKQTEEPPQKPDLVSFLKEHGLDADNQNISKLAAAFDKWNEIKQYNNEAIITLLRTGKELTLDNIYKAKYALYARGSNTEAANAAPTQLDNEIEKFLRREGFAVNSENLETSRLLINADVALTSSNLNKALFLRQINKYDDQKVLDAVCESIKAGKKASDVEIYEQNKKETSERLMAEYTDIIRALPRVTPINLEALLINSRELTLRNIALISKTAKTPETPSDEAITAKRRLVEIQLRLTTEAAARLSAKNININVLPIQEALETLKNLEKQEYEKALQVMGVAPTEKNIGEIADIIDKTRAMRPTYPQTFADIIQKRAAFTINGVASANAAIEGYDAARTETDHRYGDSFTKVEGQFSGLLEKLNIEPTAENLKAAAILSKNNIDVTPENIMRVTAIDSKIESVYDRLHPFIAADMIRNGLNPASMHIDELLTHIDSFDDAYGNGVKDKIAKYIMEMDNSNTVSDITREAVVAVYRMLNAIQKDGAAALGTALKKDAELTLESLYSDSKYFARTKAGKPDIDTVVGENLSTQIRIAMENDVRSRIDAMLEQNNMTQTPDNIQFAKNAAEYAQPALSEQTLLQADITNRLIKKITALAKPEALAAVIENKPEAANLPLALLAEELKRAGEGLPISETSSIQLQDIQPGVVMWLLQNALPVTLGNMLTAADMLKKPHIKDELLNEPDISEYLEEKGALPDENENEIPFDKTSLILNALSDIQETEPKKDVTQKASKLRQIMELAARAGHYHAPVKLRDRYSALDLYILNNNIDENKLQMCMSLNTASLGNITVYADITDKGAAFKFYAPTTAAKTALENNIEVLKELIPDTGYEVSSIEITVKELNPYEQTPIAR